MVWDFGAFSPSCQAIYILLAIFFRSHYDGAILTYFYLSYFIMVYLTLILQKPLHINGQISVDDFKQLYALAQRVKVLCGKVDVLLTANDEICTYSAKVVNQVFGVHGIRATDALLALTPSPKKEAFLSHLWVQAKSQNLSHIVFVLPPMQFAQFHHIAPHIGMCRINSAEDWELMPNNFKEQVILPEELTVSDVKKEVIDMFFNTLSMPQLM